MSFTTNLKEEITKNDISKLETLTELAAFIRFSGQIKKNKVILTIENASVARRIYKDIKYNFAINIKLIIRNQRRFRVKQIYILEITKKIDFILESLNIKQNGKKILPNDYFLASKEEKISFLRGAFLSTGSLNDPNTGGYHLEITSPHKKDGLYISRLLDEFKITSKVIKRNNHYMVYVKSAEMISDFIKMLGATNSLFYFEDIRIYRDHKNMINRLNNCEIANQEKILKSGIKQLQDIWYLKEHDLLGLLDENTQEAIKYRELYPETSLQELSEIISQETGHNIGKSGVNHYFIKVKKLAEKHRLNNNDPK